MGLFDIIERLSNLQQHDFATIPAFKQLPAVQIRALYYLFRCNHYSDTPGAVTEFLGLTKGTISQSLKKLEEQGFIMRYSDTQDKRKVKLKLSVSAKQAVSNAMRSNSFIQAQKTLPESGSLLEGQLIGFLRIIQKSTGARLFGVCHQCSYHQRRNGAPFCGLTQEGIPEQNTGLICREFEQ